MAYMFLGVLKHERVAAEDSGDEDLEFHVRQVLTHTGPVTRGDRMVDSLAGGTKSTVSLTSGRMRTG